MKKIADIIIPHQNRHDLLKDCLDRLDYRIFNINIIMGGSFSENCNKGAKLAETENLIFLNDDTLPDNEILKEMVNNESDMVGIAEYIPKDNKIYYGIGYKLINNQLKVKLATTKEEVHIPNGYCFKIKKTVWNAVNGFNEQFVNGGEDQDLGFKIIEGKYTISYIDKFMTHFHSQSIDRFIKYKENWQLLDKLWTKIKIIELLKINII
jgi:GT2 family glycosyltransferase